MCNRLLFLLLQARYTGCKAVHFFGGKEPVVRSFCFLIPSRGAQRHVNAFAASVHRLQHVWDIFHPALLGVYASRHTAV